MKKGMMTIVMFLTLYTFGEVSSNFTFSSNYFWRGMTQTMDSPAYSCLLYTSPSPRDPE